MERHPSSGWSGQSRRSRHLARPPCPQLLIWTLSISANPSLYTTPHRIAFTAHVDPETPALIAPLHSRKPSRNVKTHSNHASATHVLPHPPFSATLYAQRSNHRGPTPTPGSKIPKDFMGMGGWGYKCRQAPTQTKHKLTLSEGVRPVGLPKV